MAVDNISSEKQVIGFVLTGSSIKKTNLKSGVYQITYVPKDQTLDAITLEASYSLTDGFGSIVVASDQDVSFANLSLENDVAIIINPLNSVIQTLSALTLDTITTSSTYTQTGAAARVLVIGGGYSGVVNGAGPFITAPPGYPPAAPTVMRGGGGGRGGDIAIYDSVPLPGSIPVSVGSGAPGGYRYTPAAGGTTTFGSLSSSGGEEGGLQGGGGLSGNLISLPGGTGESAPTKVRASLSDYTPGPFSGGAGGAKAYSQFSPPANGGAGGGIAAGGGGGGGGSTYPANPFARGGGGGGGGGALPGSAGGKAPSPGFMAPAGAGGSGGVFVLRY